MSKKTYVYKVYRDDQFIATLDNVTSDFYYTYNINSAGTQIEIEVGAKFEDVGAVLATESLVDESDNHIVDEDSFDILVSSVYNFNTIPIDLGNQVKVFMFSDRYPTGLQVFGGLISSWTTSYLGDNLKITVLSWGAQLDNYLVNSDPTSQTIQQLVQDKEYTLTQLDKGSPSNSVAQSFNIASPTVVSSVTIYAKASAGTFTSGGGETITPIADTRWSLYVGTPAAPGSLIESGGASIIGTTVQAITLAFSSSQTLSGNYHLVLSNAGAGSWYYANTILAATSTNPYASGSVFTAPDVSSPVWTTVAADDLAFAVNGNSGSTSLTFTNNDTGTIIRRILDQMVSQSGRVSYATTTVDTSGSSVTYTYKVSTVLEAIKKALDLSPSNYYWYINLASGVFNFHAQGSARNHTMILGKHIHELELTYTLENVRNFVVFSGGDTGSGSNLYLADTNIASKSLYGQWLEKRSDNRVTVTATGTTFVNNILSQNSAAGFWTSITIPDSVYDIELFTIGQMIGFSGFNSSLIDNLLLQIVGIARYPNHVILKLGSLAPISDDNFEKTRRRLDLLETIDNTSTPS